MDPETGEVTAHYACKRYRKGILCRKKQFKRDAETGRMRIVTKLDEVKNEIWVLSQLRHPNCLRLHEVLESGSSCSADDGKLYIITNLQACGGVMSLQDDITGRLDLSATASGPFSFSGWRAEPAAAAAEETSAAAAEEMSAAAAETLARETSAVLAGGGDTWGSSSSSSADAGREERSADSSGSSNSSGLWDRSSTTLQESGSAATATVSSKNYHASNSSSSKPESSNSSPREKFTPGLKGTATLPEEVCRCIVRDAARGLQYMHEELNLAHRDVKPNNLLLGEDGVVQLGDMDTAEKMDSRGFVRHTKGTYIFMAPECMQVSSTADEPYVGHDGRAADVWALGITLYIMLLATPPFDVRCSLDQLFEDIARGEVEIPSSPSLSAAAAEVLRGLLQKDVSKRMTLKQLLKHPWVRDADSSHAQAYAAKVLQQVREKESSCHDA